MHFFSLSADILFIGPGYNGGYDTKIDLIPLTNDSSILEHCLPEFDHILTYPHETARTFGDFISKEIEHAKKNVFTTFFAFTI